MRPYSDDLRGRVVAAMEAGLNCRAAAERYGVAPSTAGNWYRRYRRTQSHSALPIGGDRRSKLLGEAEWIVAHLAETSDLRLVDVQHDLAARGTEASYSSVQRMVKQLGLRLKKNSVRDRARPA